MSDLVSVSVDNYMYPTNISYQNIG